MALDADPAQAGAPSPSHRHILMLPPAVDGQRRFARVTIDRPMRMSDFSSIGLHGLELNREDVIDCNSARYEETQALAGWIHATPAEVAQGIVWTSRQDDRGRAVIVVGDRLVTNGTAVAALEPGQRLHSGDALAAITQLADRLGVYLNLG